MTASTADRSQVSAAERPNGEGQRELFRLDESAPSERLDKALVRLLPGVSRATLQRWIHEGRVEVDGQKRRPRDSVGPGALIAVVPGPAPASDAEPDASVSFGVLFEDEALIVVNKPAGLVVHPARGHASHTLVNGLLARPGFERAEADARDPIGSVRPGIVHRLDKDTSGILVVAKTAAARENIKRQLQTHEIERSYWALTLGVPRSGTVRSLHGRDPRSRLRFSSRVDNGREAITEVRILEVFRRNQAALVECKLHTGRTHQIRVHLTEQLKTPILADALYGGAGSRDEVLSRAAAAIGRQALHARVLGFVHPTTGESLRFELEPPEDFQRALAVLRAES
jgi:23S rRNA pseudouridine1911/1915/1917 synthase